MDLQKTLKKIKLNENTISMVLGVLILVVVGAIVVNYFRNQTPTNSLPTGVTTEQSSSITLPAKHIVAAGETLWSIAEKYYKSGYNWVDIQTENNLANASEIEVGQEITIPDVVAKTATVTETPSSAIAQATTTPTSVPTISPSPTATTVATASPTPTPETEIAMPTKGGEEMAASQTDKIEGSSYTVVHGDNLWTIAVRAYGDGYKWTEVAKANNLAHPRVIHSGNVLSIPRT